MEPITFGLTFVGAVGGTLLVLTFMEKKEFPINEKALTLVVETIKFGSLLGLLGYVASLFL